MLLAPDISGEHIGDIVGSSVSSYRKELTLAWSCCLCSRTSQTSDAAITTTVTKGSDGDERERCRKRTSRRAESEETCRRGHATSDKTDRLPSHHPRHEPGERRARNTEREGHWRSQTGRTSSTGNRRTCEVCERTERHRGPVAPAGTGAGRVGEWESPMGLSRGNARRRQCSCFGIVPWCAMAPSRGLRGSRGVSRYWTLQGTFWGTLFVAGIISKSRPAEKGVAPCIRSGKRPGPT